MTDLASDRYTLLVNQLGDAMGRRHGWKARVAEALDIHQSYVTRVAAGGQKVGDRTIRRAQELLGLDEAFFTDAGLSEPIHHDEFLTGTPATRHDPGDDDPRGDEDAEARAIAVIAGLGQAERRRVLVYAVGRWGDEQ